MNGGGYETPSKAEIWSRFKTEGFFDVPSLKTKDYAAKNACIAALEAKVHNYQHQMGLLLLERETWTPQVEELKDALAESEMQASIQETELRTQLDDAQQMIEKLSAKEEERKSCQLISVPLVVAEPGADMSSGCMVSAAAGVSSKWLPEQQDGTSEQHDLQEDFTFWRGNSVQAVSNEDASGDVKALLAQIEKMKEELTRSAVENIRLLDQIRSLQEFHEGGEREKKALELELAAAARENELLRLENDNFRSEVEALRSNFSCSLERSSSMGRKVEELLELVEKVKVEGVSSTKLRQTEAVVAGALRREQAAEEPKKPLTAHIEKPNRLMKKKVKKKKEKPYVKWTDEETNALKKGVAEHGEGKWQEPTGVEKIMEIDEHIGCAMSGLTADARTLVEHGRVKTQNHRFSYNKSMSVESTTRALCDLPLCFGEGYEESMSRPFGVSLLIAGHDKTRPCL